MTTAEILAAWHAREITYGDAYTRLAYAGVRDPRAVLIPQPTPAGSAQGWDAVHRRSA
jgi:hypothetical protein